MSGVVLVLADTYAQASTWAHRHGYPSEDRRPRDGRSVWAYVNSWHGLLKFRHAGLYVDLRRESIEPRGAEDYLDAHGFTEVAR